jgi:hypothetical protein
LTRRTRAIRYGASTALVLAGVACGALISGSAGGTLATVLVGIGLVGVVSLVFYEVGLTEDRERASQAPAPKRTARPPGRPSSREAPRRPAPPRLRGERRRLR